MSKILNKQECIIFQLCRFLNKHCLDPDIIFWWSIGWSPGGPKFSKVSETLKYGCLWYGFQGWRIHFLHQIFKIPMFNHDFIVQLWQKLRYHQNCRISPIWPQKWIPHPQKPYRRHPYVMGLLYWGQSYQSPGWNVQDLEQAGMHHISALPILEQALPWSVDHFLVVQLLVPKWTNIFKSVWDPLLWVSTVWFSGVANPFLASDHRNS